MEKPVSTKGTRSAEGNVLYGMGRFCPPQAALCYCLFPGDGIGERSRLFTAGWEWDGNVRSVVVDGERRECTIVLAVGDSARPRYRLDRGIMCIIVIWISRQTLGYLYVKQVLHYTIYIIYNEPDIYFTMLLSVYEKLSDDQNNFS